MRLRRGPWETVKTWVLITFVVSSLGLSARVWLGAGGGYPRAPESEFYRALPPGSWKRDLAELLAPSRLVVHLGGGRHALFGPGRGGYSRVWELAVPLLAGWEYPAQGWTPQDPALAQGLRETPGLEAAFAVKLPVEVWGQVWGGRGFGQAGPQGPLLVDSVFLSLGDPPRLLVHRAYTQVYLAPPAAPQPPASPVAELKKLLADLEASGAFTCSELTSPSPQVSVRRGIYVPDQPPRLAPVEVGVESGEVADPVAEFFPDPSMVRQIVERDGAAIFTDGRRSLRVYPDGELEYQAPAAPSEGEAPQPLEVLQQAIEFAALHRGFPPGACLSQVEFPPSSPLARVSVPYRLVFMTRYLGLPLVEDKGALELVITGDGVSTYRRQVRAPTGPLGEPRPVLPASRVMALLDKNPSVLGGQAGLAPAVTDVYLAFLRLGDGGEDQGEGRGDRAVPVWAVELEGGGLLFFDGYSGEGWSWTGGELKPF